MLKNIGEKDPIVQGIGKDTIWEEAIVLNLKKEWIVMFPMLAN